MKPNYGFEIKGDKELKDALKAYIKDVKSSVTAAVQATALEALTDVRKQIQRGPKTGKVYTRGKSGAIKHRASAAGEAPATDTGALVSSTYYRLGDPQTAAIGSRLPYAFILEFGWLPNPEQTKRPSWRPAVERAAPRLQARLERVIREAKAKAGATTGRAFR